MRGAVDNRVCQMSCPRSGGVEIVGQAARRSTASCCKIRVDRGGERSTRVCSELAEWS
jgi:hypothetical protein